MRPKLSVLLLLAVATLVLVLPALPASATPAAPADNAGAAVSSGNPAARAAAAAPDAGAASTTGENASALALLTRMAAVSPGAKLDASARDLLRSSAPASNVLVMVQAARPVDLSGLGTVVHAFRWPAGEHVTFLRLPAGAIEKVAATPGVYAVSSAELALNQVPTGAPDPSPVESPLPATDPAARLALLKSAPPWRPDESSAPGPAPVGGQIGSDATVSGWYDALRGHNAKAAWDLGFRGEGVKVAVLDWPVDYTHPDLQGTWPTHPTGHPYAGWPQVYDPLPVAIAILNRTRPPDQTYSSMGQGGRIEMYQRSAVTFRNFSGRPAWTACFQPLVPVGTTSVRRLPPACNYVVPPTSKSGAVRFGHHPDQLLWPNGARPEEGITGEFAGVLLVDEHTAGLYDTVYVDLDGDRVFSDEKPVTRESPLAWRDIDGDGVADVSGGLLYWISDGVRPFPASWTYGVESEIPGAAEEIAILHTINTADAGVGSHGTSCASNVVGQGRLGVPADRSLAFRDLPGDHQPVATNLGMAPGARVISVVTAWGGGIGATETAWRYAIYGTDQTRDDDDPQVSSNSYGYSGIDNDNWEYQARLIDYYVRTFSPDTTFLFATGNGGPGYGTITAPKPATSIAVAASTQQGSTGTDSITDTTQITFGDIVPFSNRGPGGDGRVGPHVAANGADGTGAQALNFQMDGAHANASWGGTSRSAPVAAGVTALVYDAFHRKNGRWPTWSEARAILMSGARYTGYDVFTAGAGVVDAVASVRIASGAHGIFAEPAEWTAGGYRGTHYPSFANVIAPGGTVTTTITLNNPGAQPVDVRLSAATLRRTASYTSSIAVDMAKESPFTGGPDYLVPIDRARVPADTELLVARGAFPMAHFDPNDDMTYDQLFTFGVLQHTDINENGQFWTDTDGNGVVAFRLVTDASVTLTGDGANTVLDAIQGQITTPLPDGGINAEVGWFGRGCIGDAPVQSVSGKIALIERGTCTFVEKITNARNAGALAAIVYNDPRKLTIMGGTGNVGIPGVMIAREPGMVLRDKLLSGLIMNALIAPRAVTKRGLSGTFPLEAEGSEIEPFEFMRLNSDYNIRNHWSVAVHHPLERWSDGLYAAAWHSVQLPTLPTTDIAVRFDMYANRPWAALNVSPATVTIPAGGSATVAATFTAPVGAAPGALQGAIFADYARAADDVDTYAPAGYRLPFARTTIPVNANVTPAYAWQGAVTLGGAAGRDADALYDNGSVNGQFNWEWRPESGDQRFFFVDAAAPPPSTHWLFKSTWDEETIGLADIDTRVFGPSSDPFSDPDHPSNRAEDMSDVLWYGPYTLALLARSPYLVHDAQGSQGTGGRWPFNTTSGQNEDWLSAPAGEGLHEVILHNVRFSGSQLEMPFRTDVSSVQFSSAYLPIFRGTCGMVQVTPQIDLEKLTVRGFGMSPPELLYDQPARQDDPADRASSSVKRTVTVPAGAARLSVTLSGEADDDLDLLLLRDVNGNGQFEFEAEVVGESFGPAAQESIEYAGFPPAGRYQVWVHGYAVHGAGSTYDLAIEVVTGEQVTVKSAPARIAAGETGTIEVCVDPAAFAGRQPPLSGVLFLGPGAAPRLLRVPVRWVAPETIVLPSVTRHASVGARP